MGEFCSSVVDDEVISVGSEQFEVPAASQLSVDEAGQL